MGNYRKVVPLYDVRRLTAYLIGVSLPVDAKHSQCDPDKYAEGVSR